MAVGKNLHRAQKEKGSLGKPAGYSLGKDKDSKPTKVAEKSKPTKTAKKKDVKEIAETKMPDLNAGSVEAAMRMIEGTARSMGITVEEE